MTLPDEAIDKLRELSARLQAAGWTPGAQAGYEEAQSAGAPKEVLRSIREICELCTEAANWFRVHEAELLEMAKSITERDALLREAVPLLRILSPTNTALVAGMEQQLKAHELAERIRRTLEGAKDADV